MAGRFLVLNQVIREDPIEKVALELGLKEASLSLPRERAFPAGQTARAEAPGPGLCQAMC